MRILVAALVAALALAQPAYALKSTVTQNAPVQPITLGGPVSLSVSAEDPTIANLVRRAVADRLANDRKFDPILPYATDGRTHINITIVGAKSVSAGKRFWLGAMAGGSKFEAHIQVNQAGQRVDDYGVVVGTKTGSIEKRTDETAANELARVIGDKLIAR